MKPGRIDRYMPAALVIAVLAAGLAVRLWRITAEPLWLDEAYSAYAAERSLGFLWRIVPLYESHPPFYYTLLHGWVALFGSGVTALRTLGAAASIATLPAMAWVAAEAGNWLGWTAARRRRLVLAAFAFACLSLALVEMARQVRPYALMILAYALAIGLLIRIGRRGLGRRRFVLYLLLVETLLWLHNLGPLYALTLTIGLAIVLRWRALSRGDWLWLAGGHLLVAAAYLPGLAILLHQSTTWRASTWLRFSLDQTLVDHLMTLYGVPGWIGFVSPLLVILAMIALRRAKATRLAALLMMAAALPVLLAVAVSLTVVPVFVTRIMTPVAAPAVLLLAIGTVGGERRPLIGVSLAIVLATSMLVGDIQTRAAGPIQDWYRTVDWLARRFRPGDQILAYPNEGALPLRYALRDKHLAFPVRPIPADMPALELRHGFHPTGTRGVSSLPRFELRRIADEPATRAVPTIWLLRLGASTYDPGDVFLAELHRGRRIVRSWRDGPIDLIGLERITPAQSGPAVDVSGTGTGRAERR